MAPDIGWVIGLKQDECQANISTNADLLLIESSGTIFNQFVWPFFLWPQCVENFRIINCGGRVMISSKQYMDSHYRDNMVSRLCYLYRGSTNSWKISSLYWDGALFPMWTTTEGPTIPLASVFNEPLSLTIWYFCFKEITTQSLYLTK